MQQAQTLSTLLKVGNLLHSFQCKAEKKAEFKASLRLYQLFLPSLQQSPPFSLSFSAASTQTLLRLGLLGLAYI